MMFASRHTDRPPIAPAPNPQSTPGFIGPQPDPSLNDPTLMLSTNFNEAAFMHEASFSDVFDSLNWVFDGLPDTFMAPSVM